MMNTVFGRNLDFIYRTSDSKSAWQLQRTFWIRKHFLIITKNYETIIKCTHKKKTFTLITVVGAVAVFSPGLLIGGESVSARAFIIVALPRPVAGAWAEFFSFIPKAAFGRVREAISFRGFPLPCPTAGISFVSSGILEEWASIKKSESHVLHRDAILNVYNKFNSCQSPFTPTCHVLLFRDSRNSRKINQ